MILKASGLENATDECIRAKVKSRLQSALIQRLSTFILTMVVVLPYLGRMLEWENLWWAMTLNNLLKAVISDICSMVSLLVTATFFFSTTYCFQLHIKSPCYLRFSLKKKKTNDDQAFLTAEAQKHDSRFIFFLILKSNTYTM